MISSTSLSDVATRLWNVKSDIIFEQIEPYGSILSWFGRTGRCFVKTTIPVSFDHKTETSIRSVVALSFTFGRSYQDHGALLFRIEPEDA